MTPAAALGTLLTVWAHPDDESYLAGGLMAAAAARGQRVVCVTATHADGPRAGELARALEVLGVSEHLQLGHEDGACDAVDPDAAARRLAGVVEAVRPDTVVTFGPDGLTGHPDHRAVSSWVDRALALRVDAPVDLLWAASTPEQLAAFHDVHERFGVFVDGPPAAVPAAELAVSLALGGAALDRKVTALEQHRSQTAPLIDALGRERYGAWVAEEGFVRAGRTTARTR